MAYQTLLLLATALLINLGGNDAQSSSNIGDFVGQLTSLINQGGALGALGQYVGAQGAQQDAPPYRPPGPGGYIRPGHPGGYPGQQGGFQGGGGYGFPGGFPPGGVPPGGVPQGPPIGGYPGGGYPQSSLYGALASIAQYDDLRCVPRLLCEVAAGARPGSAAYTTPGTDSAGQIPFLSKDAIITLLTVLNFVDDSPLLVFGRAAVLGYTARGDPKQCIIAYPTCPRDPDKLVDYLNNHNGGFFRFFNQQIPQYAPQYQHYQPPPPHAQYPGASTAYPPPQYPSYPPQYPPYPSQYYQYPQRPRPPPGYPPRPGQRPYRKRPSYSQYYQQQQQERIQNSPPGSDYDYITSEGNNYGSNKLTFSSNLESSQYYQENENGHLTNYYSNEYSENNKNTNGNNNYNSINSFVNKKFTFPTELPSSPAPSVIPLPSTASSIPTGHDSTGSYSNRDVRRGKTLAFPKGQSSPPNRPQYLKTPGTSSTMVFPDRTGTGDLRLDLDEYGGYKTVHFASETGDNRPVPGNIFRGQRDVINLKFPEARFVGEDETISVPPDEKDTENTSLTR